MAEDKKINTEAELWSKAYDGLRSEKNGSKLLNPLRESLLKQESLRNKHVGSLRSAKGRSILLQFVSEQQKDMKVPNSQLVHLGEKAKGLIVSGVAASPPATVAVAGLFPAWDLYTTYAEEAAAQAACPDRAIDILAMRMTEVDSTAVKPTDNRPEILQARAILEKRYVALFRLILTITAKLVIAYSKNAFSKALKIMLGVFAWSDDLDALRSADHDCEQSLESVARLKADAIPVAMFNKGRNELHEAAASGWLKQADMASYLKTCPIDAKTGHLQWTALMLAAEQGHTEAVNVLLLYPLDINATNARGHTALHIAAWQGHLQIVRMLVAGYRRARLDLPDAEKSWTPLMAASGRGHTAVVTAIVRSRKEKKPWLGATARDGRTALHIAAENGHAATVQELVKAGAKVNVTSRSGRAPLLDAAANGHVEVVRASVENGADINAKSYHLCTALHLAAENDKLETVKWLVENGVEVNATITRGTKSGVRPVDVATGASKEFLQIWR